MIAFTVMKTKILTVLSKRIITGVMLAVLLVPNLKALAAHDNNIPFYSAFPSSSFDFEISNGIKEISVEERDPEEVRTVSGMSGSRMTSVRICPENSAISNFGFDVTPAKYITGLITERGICRPLEKDIKEMFSDKFI